MSGGQIRGGERPRIRSMSMNSLVGDPGLLTNRYNPAYIQFFKSADLINPSHIFVFLDEHPDTINDGFFMNRLDERAGAICQRPIITAQQAFLSPTATPKRIGGSSRLRAGRSVRRSKAVSRHLSCIPPIDFDWLKERSSVKRQ